MIWHALRIVEGFCDLPPVVVVGYKAEDVEAAVPGMAKFALQEQQLGTGHAVASAKSQLEGKVDTILVTFADMPLLRKESLVELIEIHLKSNSPVTMTSFIGEPGSAFGRVVTQSRWHGGGNR